MGPKEMEPCVQSLESHHIQIDNAHIRKTLLVTLQFGTWWQNEIDRERWNEL